MNARLTWHELSCLKPGAVVAFGCNYGGESAVGPFDVPAGTVCTIVETGLNEIWGGLIVRPVDDADRVPLVYAQTEHNGCIFISDTPEPGVSCFPETPDEDAEYGATWGMESPFIIHDTCPVECI